MKELIKQLRAIKYSHENMHLVAANAIEKLQAKLDWIDSNTTYHDIDRAYTTEAVNVPVLASVSERIWYHATDDKTSYPFSAVIDTAMKADTAREGCGDCFPQDCEYPKCLPGEE